MIDTLSLPQNAVVLLPVDQLLAGIDGLISKRIREKQIEDLQEKLLSPKETCNLFSPKISLVTLDSWSEKGYLKKYHLGGRTYFKYSEVMQSLTSLKRYQRSNAE